MPTLPGPKLPDPANRSIGERERELVSRITSKYDFFMELWIDQAGKKGLGAFVFEFGMSEEVAKEPGWEFWTVAELRRHLRKARQLDEMMFRWLSATEGEEVIPIVVLIQREDPARQIVRMIEVRPQSSRGESKRS